VWGGGGGACRAVRARCLMTASVSCVRPAHKDHTHPRASPPKTPNPNSNPNLRAHGAGLRSAVLHRRAG
jgi:hypothetical protein